MTSSNPLSESELEDASRAASRGVMWILSSTIVWQSVSWILTLATARILAPSDYGLIALADTITPYLVMLATLRVDSWVLQLDRFSEEDQSAIQTFVVLFGVAVFAVSVSLAPLLSSFYGRPEIVAPYCVLCGVILIRSLRVIPEARLRRQLRFESIALSNFLVGILRAVLQLALASFGWRYWSLVTASMLAEVLLSCWMIAAAGMPKRIGWDHGLIRSAAAFGVPASLSHVCWIVFSTADNLVVGRFFGVVTLGFYSMAFYLTELPLSKLNSVLGPVLAPYYSRLRFNVSELTRVSLRLNRISAALVAPVLLGLCAIADPFVSFVFGEHWMPLVEPFRVMCVVSLMRALSGNTTTIMLAIGKARDAFLVSLVPALVMPVAFYIGALQYGLNGVYGAWLLVYPLAGPVLSWILLGPLLGLSVRAQAVNVAAPVLGSVFMAVVVCLADRYLFAQWAEFPRLVCDIGLGMLIGVGFLRTVFWDEAKDAVRLLRAARSGDTGSASPAASAESAQPMVT